VIVGSGKHIYEPALEWGKLPKGHSFTSVPGMAVDSHDRVYVFNRNPNIVYILDSDGNFVNMWGKDRFADYFQHRAHGIYIGHDQRVYLTDIGDHTVRKFTLDGDLLLTLGTPGNPGKEREPFRRPCAAAISRSGDIFVADGYDNARVHKYSPEGKLLMSWGKPGSGPGEFNLPHGIWVDKDDRIWVADRWNNRIQIFTTEGKFLKQLTGFDEPQVVFIDSENVVYVPEGAGRMSILSLDGELFTRWGCEKNFLLDFISKAPGAFIPYRDVQDQVLKAPGKFISAHDCCVDSKGSLYVGEAQRGQRITKFVRKR